MKLQNLIDLVYHIVGHFYRYNVAADEITLEADDGVFLAIYLRKSYPEKVILSLEEGVVELSSPVISVLDLIEDYYPDYMIEVMDHSPDVWLDDVFRKEIRSRFPMVFEELEIYESAVDKIAKKYNVDFRWVIEPPGDAFARLRLKLVNRNTEEVYRVVSEAIDIFMNYCSELGVEKVYSGFHEDSSVLFNNFLSYIDFVKNFHVISIDRGFRINKVRMHHSLGEFPIEKPYIQLYMTHNKYGDFYLEMEIRRNIVIGIRFLKPDRAKDAVEWILINGFKVSDRDKHLYSITFNNIREAFDFITKRLLEI